MTANVKRHERKPVTRGARRQGARSGRRTHRVLVTGYPGFLGKRLVARLLQQRGVYCYLLVQQKFYEDAKSYVERLGGQATGHAKILVGDIADMHLGLSAPEVGELVEKVTDIYHLAAISYLRVSDQRMWRVNVEGTANVLELAGQCRRLQRFNHMSSCFVSGNRKGVIMEDELERGQSFRNHYEKTKFEAEKLVRQASGSLPVSIYRPAIVVGDSRTGEIGRFDGPYYLGMLLASSPVSVPLPLPGRGEAPVHMAPVDYIIEALLALSQEPRAVGQTFHLVDPNPLSARRVYELVAERTGRRAPRLRMSVGLAKGLLKIPGLERLSRAHRQALDYLDTMVFYNHTNADRYLLPLGLTCPEFPSYVDRLIEYVRVTVAARHEQQEEADPLA